MLDSNSFQSSKINHYKESTRTVDYYKILSIVTFILYFFFVIFGTALPFRPEVRDIDEIATSNIFNQIIFSTLFITALISLIPKWNDFIILIKREKYLTIFFVWSLMTVIWSSYSFVSFKRYFQVITTIIVCASVLLNIKSSEELVKYLKYLLGAYIIISLLSVFTIPAAKDSIGDWKGLAPQKNGLGAVAIFSVLIWFLSIKDGGLLKRVFNFLMFLFSIIVLFGSKSFTNELTVIILFCIGIALIIDNNFNVITSKKVLFSLVFLWSIGFVVAILLVDPKWIGDFLGVGGKNLTLTGRTELWSDILQIAKKHIIYGCGFQGFWVIGSPVTDKLYLKYIWIPRQAHNGYVDILNETGLIGLILFIFTIIKYFVSLAHYRKPHFWKWFVISAIILNITESTFIRPNMIPGVMYIFGYLALMSDIYKDEISNSLKKVSP